jgi:phage terminase large subunit
MSFADAFVKAASDGEKLCCGREFQNSISDSVHALLRSRIEALQAPGFDIGEKAIDHSSGGSVIYKGLRGNIQSLKSMYGVKRFWIEEGQTLSEDSIDIALPTIRENDSEIWISMNRGSSKDPVSKRYLNKHEACLAAHGYYEDDEMIIVQINWQDNPFFPEVLNKQRLSDFAAMSRAKYDHIWCGAYSDSVENAIILPEWFDACIDAHVKLKFEALGAEIVAHDPSDSGDAKALAYRHGSVIKDVKEKEDGDVNDACDWATAYANNIKADEFIWDADGLGLSLKRQIAEAFTGKKVLLTAFSGASGAANPEAKYDPIDDELSKSKTNKEAFFNRRAQRYWNLRDRCYRTYKAVQTGKYTDPAQLISFSSSIKNMAKLRSEVCRIPQKDNKNGRIQIMSKPEMKAIGIDSPNMADSVMMTLEGGQPRKAPAPVVIAVPTVSNYARR